MIEYIYIAANIYIFAQCNLNVNVNFSTLGSILHFNVKLFSELNIYNTLLYNYVESMC